MKLIKESIEDVQYIVEAVDGQGTKSHKIRGIFLQCEMANRNGRMYPLNTVSNVVKTYTENFIKKNRALGELGHPEGPTINLDRVSHMITKLERDGNNFVGEAKILDTPNGNIVKALMDAGAQLGVSSRGLGSVVQKEGVNVVQPDFMLATAADIVADPSAPDAFVQSIMEGADWVYNASTNSWMMAEQIRSKINKMTTKQVNSNQAALFEAFLKSLK
jgi:hypothetical protein